MQIRFGGLSPDLHEQLGFPKKDLELEQRLADAVTSCQIHGVLTDSETHKARKRIVKMIDNRIENDSEVS